jgi:hypothetical protein
MEMIRTPNLAPPPKLHPLETPRHLRHWPDERETLGTRWTWEFLFAFVFIIGPEEGPGDQEDKGGKEDGASGGAYQAI